MRCHWTHPHDPHPWTPIVSDLDEAQVLHVFTDAPIWCPGNRDEEEN